MHCKSVKGFAILRKITKCPPLARSDKAIRRGTTAAANRKPLDHPASTDRVVFDYVIRRFNLCSARLNKPQGLDFR